MIKVFGFYIAREPIIEVREVVKEVVKEERVVFSGGESLIDVYQVKYPPQGYGGLRLCFSWHGNFYLSCAQALNECSGAQVTKLQAVKIGNDFFAVNSLGKIKVQPKPKKTGKKASK